MHNSPDNETLISNIGIVQIHNKQINKNIEFLNPKY